MGNFDSKSRLVRALKFKEARETATCYSVTCRLGFPTNKYNHFSPWHLQEKRKRKTAIHEYLFEPKMLTTCNPSGYNNKESWKDFPFTSQKRIDCFSIPLQQLYNITISFSLQFTPQKSEASASTTAGAVRVILVNKLLNASSSCSIRILLLQKLQPCKSSSQAKKAQRHHFVERFLRLMIIFLTIGMTCAGQHQGDTLLFQV